MFSLQSLRERNAAQRFLTPKAKSCQCDKKGKVLFESAIDIRLGKQCLQGMTFETSNFLSACCRKKKHLCGRQFLFFMPFY